MASLNKSALSLGSVTLAIALLGKLFFRFFKTLVPLKMAFFTNVVDLQAALNACVSVQDWEMLTESVLLPEEWIPIAYTRLTHLTLQEIEVSSDLSNGILRSVAFLKALILS